MTVLTEMIARIAALLTASGCPAGQAPLGALILIYLLVTALLAFFLVGMIVRRRHRARKPMASPPDLES